MDLRLGGGGMGEVWRAEDLVLGRTVAVKVLLPALMDDPGFITRFRGEARAMASLRHPGVVDVYDYGSCGLDDGSQVSYLVMEHVEGESLDKTLRRGPLSHSAAMRLVAEVADALAAAHAQGIVHRDVKPANLMVRTNGAVALTDFGIAKAASGDQLTTRGMVLGSVGYCAPEQATSGVVTPAADIYSLGVVGYQCLTGKPPFEGETPIQIIFKHLNAVPPTLPPDVPEAHRQVVERAMRKDPAARWASAAEMAEAARRAATDPGAAVLPDPGAESRDDDPTADVRGAAPAPTVATGGDAAGRRRRAITIAATAGAAALATVTLGAAVLLAGSGTQTTLSPRTGGVEQTVSPTAEQVRPGTGPDGGPATRRPRKQAGSPAPTASLSGTPTPTSVPTGTATPSPTEEPTQSPSEEPSQPPSTPDPGQEEPEPTVEPSEEPSAEPSAKVPDVQCVRAPCP
ncbi:serine/threonine-protein kinase [Thermocatellispora tengchongensis]|uniref:serine/threonine-protein kinase n=1 Tax=Thermocatellispora tengchongensis TaxID=1073253 RepID=UPI003645A838